MGYVPDDALGHAPTTTETTLRPRNDTADDTDAVYGLVVDLFARTFGVMKSRIRLTRLRSRKPLPLVLQRLPAKRGSEATETAGSPLG
jgi:hypothetical protein